MATSPVTLDLSKSKPISSGVTLDLSKSQPLTKGPSAPEPSLIGRLTEIRPHQPGMSVGQHVVTALGNVGAGAMTPILHPVDTAIGAARMITDPYETMAYPLTHHPSQSMELANSLVHHPAGTIESGIGQAATMGGLSEIPPETASAPIRGAAKAINAAKRNAPAIMTPTLGTIGLATGAKFGIPEAMAGGGYGAYKGMQLGKYIQKAPDIPGERFGLPPEPPSYDQSVFEKAAAQPKSQPFDPMSARQGMPQPPDRGTNFRAPMQGPRQESPATGPMKADISKLGPPAGVGKYQPPERMPPPVRTAPIERAPEPVAEAATSPRMSVQDQIEAARQLGFKNVGDAMRAHGQAWDDMVNGKSSRPEPPSVRPGNPTPFSTPEVSEAQMHSPWGRPVPEASEALESLEQRKATNANMGSTPKSTSMDQFRGVATPEVPRSPFVKPFNREAYSPETDPTLKSNVELAKRAGRQSTKKDNFENTLADAQKKRWTD